MMEMIEGFELSPQQKHLVELQNCSSNFPYRAQCAVQIKGKIESKTLKSAIKQVISTHEILRTNFNSVPGMTLPLQVIAPDCNFNFSEYDYRGIELEAQLSKMELLWKEYNQLPFDFYHNSLFHCALVTLAESESVLLLNLPALYVDIKGLDNLVFKIGNAYRNYVKGEEIVDEVLQYADISEWQNQLLQDEEQELTLAKGYWRKQNITDCLSIKLPVERQFDREYGFESSYFHFTVNPTQVQQISEYIQKEKVSIDLFFLACWQILLWRITQQSEVLIGVGFEGRKYEELQDSIGLLAKYLPLKSNFKQGLYFQDILKQIQLKLDSIDTWQEQFSWESIIDENKNDINTLFIPFNFNFTTLDSHIFDDISFSIIKQDVCFDKFKIKLSFTQNQDDLVAQLYYDAKSFGRNYIQCLAEQFQTLLSSVLDSPETVIDKIEILSEVEREKILHQFNDTNHDYPAYKCIHQLFEEQVEKTPLSVAVVFADQQLTYQQLNQRANQLAHHLQILGVTSETLVGIYVERSVEMIVGLLAILKAGGAYVPLDPNYPQQRLSYIFNDSGVEVLLTQQSLIESLPPHQAQLVCLDMECEAIEQQCEDNLNAEVKLDNLAYVIYTSGSTGQPKGVAIEHKSIVNYSCSLIKIINVKPSSNFANVSTFSADLGNTVIFPCLLTGGCLHIISHEIASDTNAIGEYFSSNQIDYLKIVPSHLAALLTSSNPELVLPNETLILGGEASSSDWVETILNQSPNCNIINHYGPTEATVGVLTYLLDRKSLPLISSTIPMGRPIANTQIYILDRHLQPVPVGVPGELYIGGDGLARGYLNNQELTQEKFIPNPFDRCKSKRLYKTGDLAQYLSDGNIEFLGRIDSQVKIRGFRIELGEIEAVLNSHPQIQQAVVIVTEHAGTKRLVAYVVLDESLTTQKLREFVKSKLPEYMVPSGIVTLDSLPLTPNGKLDRKALPAPDGVERKHEYVAPRTPIEQTLTKIWEKLLIKEKVSIHDNFFEIGGDSILSIQVISRAKNSGIQITHKQIFQYPTIAELAKIVNTKVSLECQQGLVTGVAPLIPIQHWFFEQNFANSHHWNQSFLFQLKQTLNPVILEQALQHIIEHHDALRLRFDYIESGWQQIHTLPSETIPFTRIDLSNKTPEEQTTEISTTATKLQKSFNLSDGPLITVALFDLGTQQPSRLLIAIHHLVVDGVSWRILLSDLQQVYQQLTQGEVVKLPAKTTSFKKWAEKLREYARSPKIQKELEYWLNSSQTQLNSLPVDFSNGKNTMAEADTVSVQLNATDTQELLQKVPAIYQTQINDVLLSALLQAFNQWTGDQQLTIDLEGHGREELFPDVNLSRTVGWFTTVFPVLLELNGHSQPEDILLAVKKKLHSIPERGIGYGVLRYMSDSQAKLNYDTAQVKFNYLGQIDQQQTELSLFAPAQESKGIRKCLQGNRSHLIDIDLIVSNGQLQIDWTYSKAIHHQQTIENLANSFLEKLQGLITHCQSRKICQ